MTVLDEGHRYSLKDNGEKTESVILTFFKDSELNSEGYPGTTNQEVLRALINRVKFLNKQKEWSGNAEIIYYLRKALALHEVRHLERVIEEGYPIEDVKPIKPNDHFIPNKSLWKKEKKGSI